MSDINAGMGVSQLPRSLLFVPGSEERKVAKAFAESGADAVVVDLEDAVAVAMKDRARVMALSALSAADQAGPARMIRLNGADTPHFAADIAAVATLDAGTIDAVVVPKATSEAVAAVAEVGLPVIAIVETAVGLRRAYETARSACVFALLLGSADLAAELNLTRRPNRHALLYPRSQLVVDSAAAAIAPPVDGVYENFRDAKGLEAEARYAHALGFGGKACIHPAQVPVVNRAFSPSLEEIEWAHAVVDLDAAGAEEGRGAAALEGTLIDAAVVRRASQILSRAKGAST